MSAKQMVLNFFAGPGVGKSTTAAGVFSLLKMRGYNVELVQEYAKELAWEGVVTSGDHQLEILTEQYRRMQRLIGKVDLIITDSPLLMSLVYADADMVPLLHPICRALYSGPFDNYDVVLDRCKGYNPNGRFQTEAGARDIDDRILAVITGTGNPNGYVRGNPPADVARLEYLTTQVEEWCELYDCVRY